MAHCDCCADLMAVKCCCRGKVLGVIGDICRTLAIFALLFVPYWLHTAERVPR